mmetsp:Transcript_19540/g.36615  ORF Transcript_19540/g.36615 Transcript_19540/m.36615 type:complete len:226 (-) Transcript_19540:218-895(-)
MRVTLASILSLIAVIGTSGFERELEERQLGRGWNRAKYFEKYLDIFERCCEPDFVPGGDRFDCRCKVRTLPWFGIFDKWTSSCEGTTRWPQKSILAKCSIAALAKSIPGFETLNGALEDTGLDEVLMGKGPFTVFAPTDDAFDDAFAGNEFDGLALADVLKYHVVEGKVLSTDLSNGDVTTVNGATINVDLSSGVKINESTVTIPDNEACNGVVHVIDKVLIPPP